MRRKKFLHERNAEWDRPRLRQDRAAPAPPPHPPPLPTPRESSPPRPQNSTERMNTNFSSNSTRWKRKTDQKTQDRSPNVDLIQLWIDLGVKSNPRKRRNWEERDPNREREREGEVEEEEEETNQRCYETLEFEKRFSETQQTEREGRRKTRESNRVCCYELILLSPLVFNMQENEKKETIRIWLGIVLIQWI